MAYKQITDQFSLHDKSHKGLWAKTEVIGGYGKVKNNPYGKSTLDEVIFTQHNIVPIGGVSYIMERSFGASEQQITIPTLYSSDGIGAVDSAKPTETYTVPGGIATVNYRYGHFVQLFAVGITGTAENDVTIYDPSYRENNVRMTMVNPDGLTVTGTLIPFRYTVEDLNSVDRLKYFGKKVDSDGVTGYYLKKFETDAVIKHLWRTSDESSTETPVTDADVWNPAYTANAVESFTEIILKIDEKDVKEWFVHLQQEDRARINTIALYDGQYVSDDKYGDYRDVRMFSKLCINPEYLNASKDLNIIYRVYGS